MKNLIELYDAHQGKLSDKWHLYLSEYDRLLAPYREKEINLLEIGVQNGGSLEIWAQYFSAANYLVGCDINEDCRNLDFDDERIHLIVGDANSVDVKNKITNIASKFDIVIDDGSHFSSDIVKTFAHYFPLLKCNGIFIAEDLHCSYWQHYEGGLYDPYSANSFFKYISDIINHEHWGVEKNRIEYIAGFIKRYDLTIDESMLSQIHSVEFINSVCVVRKRAASENVLGQRVMVGKHEAVVEVSHLRYATDRPRADETRNPWSAMAEAPSEQFSSLKLAITEREAKITQLSRTTAQGEAQITQLSQTAAKREVHNLELREEVAAMRNSLSWKLTSPLRWALHKASQLASLAALVPKAIQFGGGPAATARQALAVYQSEGLPGLKRGLTAVRTADVVNPAPGSGGFDRNDYVEWVRRYDTITPEQRATMNHRIQQFATTPSISVIMPVYNPNPVWLQEAIESVQGQIYPHWELCIADDASSDPRIKPLLQKLAAADSRIKVVYRPKNGHISAASNSAIEVATGEWLALLDHDDLLPEHALYWVADAINEHPGVKLIYSDEDKITEQGQRIYPYFKCDWNIDLFYSHNMFCHLGVYSAQVVRAVGGFRLGYEGSQDYDLALRCVEQVGTKGIYHIARVLYHWRVHAQSTAQSADRKPYAMLAGERALNNYFERTNTDCRAELISYGYRARYALPVALPLVSIIIPTRNGLELLEQCIDSIVQKTTYTNYEILVVDNGSDDPATLTYLATLAQQPNVKVLRDDRRFNYSALNNMAAKAANGQVLALLNNDIEVISPDWLSEMVALVLQPGVGAVGAKLYYPNNYVQHAGVVTGIGGVAGHAHKNLHAKSLGYFGRASLMQSFAAVTGACLVVGKSEYQEVGGLNEDHLAVAFNDIDFCLKLQQAGYRNVWTPYAALYHHESATRGYEDSPEKIARFNAEVKYMTATWGAQINNDPAYSPNLSLDFEDFSYAWPPRRGD